MSSQGWTPGGRLGARDAAHADLLTAASHSHIKVTIKDDTLGLGARVGRETEPTGLDAFKGLLGRLNGKSDGELKQEQRKRDDVKLARYVALKFQEVRFVHGGLLAQEKVEHPPASKPQESQKNSESNGDNQQSDEEDASSSDSSIAVRKSISKSKSKSKSKPKSKSSKKSRSSTDDDENSASISDSKKKKKSKKRKADAAETTSTEQADAPSQQESEPSKSTLEKTTVSRERRPMGRQAFRSRHIAQKKRALMDDKSLNEVSLCRSAIIPDFVPVLIHIRFSW
jgi:Pin2-interacting protein X1